MLEPPFEVATIATCYGGPTAGPQALVRTPKAETKVEDGKAVAGLRGAWQDQQPQQDGRCGHDRRIDGCQPRQLDDRWSGNKNKAS